MNDKRRYELCLCCRQEDVVEDEDNDVKAYRLHIIDLIKQAIKSGKEWSNLSHGFFFGKAYIDMLCDTCPYMAEHIVFAGKPMRRLTRK